MYYDGIGLIDAVPLAGWSRQTPGGHVMVPPTLELAIAPPTAHYPTAGAALQAFAVQLLIKLHFTRCIMTVSTDTSLSRFAPPTAASQ